MSDDSKKLFRPKQIVIISGSMLAGIGFFLFRRYYENDRLTNIDLFAALFTVLAVATIVFFMTRKANRAE